MKKITLIVRAGNECTILEIDAPAAIADQMLEALVNAHTEPGVGITAYID